VQPLAPLRRFRSLANAERACGVVQLAARSPRSNTVLAQRGAREERSEPERSVRGSLEHVGTDVRAEPRSRMLERLRIVRRSHGASFFGLFVESGEA
jgi:hypothetical protein